MGARILREGIGRCREGREEGSRVEERWGATSWAGSALAGNWVGRMMRLKEEVRTKLAIGERRIGSWCMSTSCSSLSPLATAP